MAYNSTISTEFITGISTSIFEQWWLPILQVKYFVVVIAFGTIIFIGVVGNLLGFFLLVMTDHKEELNASSICIRYTIIADIVAVGFGSVNHWLSSLISFGLRDYATWTCQGHFFITHSAREMSIWFEILFSIIRVVAVTLPHKLRVIFTVRRTRISCGIISIFIVIKYLAHSLSQRVQEFSWGKKCYFLSDFNAILFGVLELITSVVIPYPIYVISSIVVGWKIGRALKKRLTLTHASDHTLHHEMKHILSEEKSKGTNRLLFLNNFAFAFMYSPYTIYRVFEATHSLLETQDPAEAAFLDLIYRLVNIFIYLHHAIYCLFLLSGHKYRRTLIDLFRIK